MKKNEHVSVRGSLATRVTSCSCVILVLFLALGMTACNENETLLDAARQAAKEQRLAAEAERARVEAERARAVEEADRCRASMELAEQALRRNVEDLCGLLGIEWTAERSDVVAGMSVAELEALWSDLLSQKRWP